MFTANPISWLLLWEGVAGLGIQETVQPPGAYQIYAVSPSYWPGELRGDNWEGAWSSVAAGWHHLAYVSTAGLFIDGKKQTKQDWFIISESVTLNEGVCAVGFTGVDTMAPGYGWDEVRVSSKARYSADFQPPTARFEPDAHTVALWHFDEPAGALQFADASGHGFTLTAMNGATLVNLGDSVGLTLAVVAGPAIELDLTGHIGRRYRIESSTDLVNWTVFTEFVLSESPTHLMDNFSPVGATFYRLVAE